MHIREEKIMDKANILFDKTEIIIQIAAKNAMSINMRAEDIMSITFQPTKERKLFKVLDSEVILIKPKKRPVPIAITKGMIECNKKASSWESIMTNMEKFAKDNKISTAHEAEDWVPPKFD